MRQKLLIAAVLCALVVVGFIVASRVSIPFAGAGLLLEVAYFLLITFLAWQSSLRYGGRAIAMLLALIATSALSTYFGSLSFGKLDFDLAAVIQNTGVHLVLSLGFLVLVWLIDRAMTGLQSRRQPT